MADNKKKKVSFAEGLKAQAQKLIPSLADRARNSDEFIVVDNDGEEMVIPRGTGKDRLPDDVWEQLKLRSAKRPASGPGSEEFVKRADKKDADIERRSQLGQLIDNPHYQSGPESLIQTEDEKKLLQKMDRNSAIDFLDERLKKQELKKQVQEESSEPVDSPAEEEGELPATKPAAPYISQKELKAQTEQYKADKGKIGRVDETPTEKQGNPETDFLPMPGGEGSTAPTPGTQTEMEGGVSSAPRRAGGGTKMGMISSMLGDVATGATPAVGPEEARRQRFADPEADKRSLETARNLDRVNAQGEQNAAEDLAALGKVNDAVGAVNQYNPLNVKSWTQPLANMRDKADRVIGGEDLLPDAGRFPRRVAQGAGIGAGAMMETAGNVLGMPNLAAKGADIKNTGLLGDLVDVERPGSNSPAVAPADPNLAHSDQVPQDTQVAPGSGGSEGVSLSMNLPGGFSPAKVDPSLEQSREADMAEFRKKVDQANETVAASEIVKDGLVRKAAEREMLVQGEAAKLASLATEAKMRGINEAKRYDTAKLAVMEQARKAAADPINPNRFWQDKTAGQQAAAVIAGALFGFTGQGMNWLQRIDGLVNADNALQATDRASKVAGLKEQASALGEAGQQALRLGATEAEAHVIERNAKLEGLKSYLDMLAMKSTNMQQKAQAAMMSTQLQQHILAADGQGMELAMQKAANENTAMYHNAQLAQQRAAIAIKAAGAGKGGAQTKIPQAQQGIISAAEAGLGMLPELEKAIGNPKGEISTALKDQIAKQFPGTDANNRSISTAFLNRAIFAGIDKSVINSADQKFLDELQSGVGIASLRKPGAIAALRRMLNESKKAAIRTAQQLDQNVGGLTPTDTTSPEDFGFEAKQ